MVYDGLVPAGFSPAEGDPTGVGSVAILDADIPDPTQVPVAVSSSGIAVAPGTVYVAMGNAVVAYRP